MDPYVLFVVCIIIGLPASVVGLVALIFDWEALDLPGLFYGLFGAATLATVVMVTIMVKTRAVSLVIVGALYGGAYMFFFFMALSRILSEIIGRYEQSRLPVVGYEHALRKERLGRLHEAVELYEEYCRMRGDDKDAHIHYAACLVKLARWDEAIEVQRRIFALSTGVARMAAGIEIVYSLAAYKGDRNAAREELKTLWAHFEGSGLEKELKSAIRDLNIRISGDPRPYEEKVDLA